MMTLNILYVVLTIAIALIAGFGAYALWQIAKASKEAAKMAAKTNKQLDKIDVAVTNATDAVNSVSRLVQRATDALSQPMEGIMKGIKIAQTFIQKFREQKGTDECECEPDNDNKDCNCE
jgi:uncharacterized protein HemX